TMRAPRPEDTLNTDSVVLGLRALFRPEAARGLKADYELRLAGVVAHARIDDGAVEVGEGPLENPDLVLETDFALRAVLTGELSASEAVESGHLRLGGDRDLLEPFVEVFRIAPAPELAAS
ncbi:MAG: SCP2 sterol-binding domain-containing protein, partial [Gaiellaceae bacterium]